MRNIRHFSAMLIALFLVFPSAIRARSFLNTDSLENVLNTQKLTPVEQLDIYDKIFNNVGIMDKCVIFAEKGLALAEKENDKAYMSLFNAYLGDVSYSTGNHDKSIAYLEKALTLAQDVKSEKLEAMAYLILGNVYFGQPTAQKEALEYYMKALFFFEKIEDKKNCLIVLGNIAGIHGTLHDHDRAIYYLEQSKTIAEELGDVVGIFYYYQGLGNIYTDKREYDKALESELKALEIARSIKANGLEAFATDALADIYSVGLEEYDKAEEYAKEALHLAEEAGIQPILINARMQLAAIYLEQKRYKECDAAASMAYEMDSINILTSKSAIPMIVMANIHLGNKDKAAFFFQKHKDFILQYNDESLHKSLSEMEVKYETEKKELHITALEKEKVFYIWLGLAGGILLLSLLLLFIVRHRLEVSKRKLAEQQTIIAEQQIKYLEQQQQIIAAQSAMDGETAERSRLARDLHDGLGGMLSVIKLNLNDLEHLEKVRELLDQSINELRRVAHHLMPESLLRYGLKTALEDFCKSAPNVKFHYFGNENHLDDRIEVLIYRCAHELVNNAIKHANASTINVQLVQDPNLISLTVEDDGCGFDTETANPGMGLGNLRARVAAYNGKINLFSSPGKGTEVSVELALQ